MMPLRYLQSIPGQTWTKTSEDGSHGVFPFKLIPGASSWGPMNDGEAIRRSGWGPDSTSIDEGVLIPSNTLAREQVLAVAGRAGSEISHLRKRLIFHA